MTPSVVRGVPPRHAAPALIRTAAAAHPSAALASLPAVPELLPGDGLAIREQPDAQGSQPAARPAPVTNFLVIGWAALACAIAAKDGRYAAIPLLLAVTGGICVALAVARLGGLGRYGTWARATGGAWPLAAAVLVLGPVLRHPRYYAHGGFATASDVLAVVAGALAGLALLLAPGPPGPPGPAGSTVAPAGRRPGPARAVLAIWGAFAAGIAAGACMIVASPAPRIDVWHLLQVSSEGLAHGQDMYRQQWATSMAAHQAAGGGLFDVYPYLPGTTVLLAPFRFATGDVRAGLLTALVLAAAAIAGIARRSGCRAVALPLLVILFPESTYALQQSWTEPLLIAALGGMVWAVLAGRGRLAVAFLAAALASKQHVALLLPVAAAWPAFGLRRSAAAGGIALCAVLPWVVASPRDFWHDAVRTNLDYPVLDDSLSLPGWLHHFGLDAGFSLTAVALCVAYGLAWRARGSAAGFAAGAALVIVALDLTNKQTFFNHYTLAMGLIVIALAASPPAATTLAPDRPDIVE